MAANRHTCCICYEPRHPVEKDHINGDRTDNAWNNLAVLCRNCHGLVTATGNLGSKYTPGEVLRYKQLWEKRCAEADEDEIDSLPAGYWHRADVIECREHSFAAPAAWRYVLLLINWDDKATEVAVDAAVWAAEE